ncbi:MAG: PilW family protein [Rhodoferax sp.]
MRQGSSGHRGTSRRVQYGVSIVEVMIALTLGLVAVGAAAAIYLANRKSFATAESIARMEENARFAVDLLSRDIREAGNSICGGALISTNVVTPTNTWALWDRGLVGDVLTSGSPSAGFTIAAPTGATRQLANTSSLLIWSASAAGTPIQITGHNRTTRTFTTSGDSGFQPNDVVVACDGSQVLTVEVETDPSGNDLTYVDNAASSPQINPGGYLTPLTAHIWYVGKSATQPGAYSLRRLSIDKTGAWGGNNDEMVTGVTDLQISYLLADTFGAPSASSYQNAAAVGTQWPLVSAVRLTLTLATVDKTGSSGSAATVITHDVPMTAGIKVRLP